MFAGWNLLFVLAVLCGKSVGFFWPFTALTATNVHEAATDAPESDNKKVAIIGAGAGGASTAYYLKQFTDEANIAVDITVFERSNYVGGRSITVNAFNDPLEPVELGASIFVATNEILKNNTDKFGLKVKPSETEYDEILGIWNGETFVYTQKDSGWYFWDIAKLLWKFGLAPIRTQRLMKATVGKFKKLYEAPFFPFRSLSDRAFDLDLTSVTSLTGEQFLAENSIGAPFSTDIIQASTRVNYGQNLGLIHGLETMVCMAIDGAMQIDSGNWQIFDGMIKSSNATLHLEREVTAVSKENGKFKVKSSSKNNSSIKQLKSELFDTVVLAAPFQYSKIDVEEGLLKHTPDNIPYVSLHVTLFASPYTFSRSFFNLSDNTEVPTSVLTTLPPNEIPTKGSSEKGVGKPGFFSISTLRPITNPKTLQKEFLYKIFSPNAITPEFLGSLFNVSMPSNLSTISIDSGDAISWFYPHVWNSYPYEYPRITFEDSELARNFYYTSGMDSFISTMETNALMGMNIARLITDDYLRVAVEKEGEAGVGNGEQKPLLAVGRVAEL